MVYLGVRFELPSNHVIRPCVNSDLLRVGPAGDGGYCLTKSSLSNCDFFISIGLGWNVAFEQDLINLYSMRGVGIDPGWSIFLWLKHFVKKLLMRDRPRDVNFFTDVSQFVRQFIFRIKNPSFKIINKKCASSPLSRKDIDINSVLRRNSQQKSILLKLDIEGDEYEILKSMRSLAQISTLIVEFHEINSKYKEFCTIVCKLLEQFHVSHVHINPTVTQSGGFMPDVLEVTFERTCSAPSHKSRAALPIMNLDTEGWDSNKVHTIVFE